MPLRLKQIVLALLHIDGRDSLGYHVLPIAALEAFADRALLRGVGL